MSSKKTFLIGIDGCSWNYVDPLLKKGKLPNIEFLIKNGTRSILNSTIPAVSPVAWSTFITGKQPDKHGIFDWSKYDEQSVKAITKKIKSIMHRIRLFIHHPFSVKER